MRFLVIHNWNGREHAELTNLIHARALHPRLGYEIERYDLDGEQRTWDIAALMQAREFGQLTLYVAPVVKPVPTCWAKLGLDAGADVGAILAAYETRAAAHVGRWDTQMQLRRARDAALRLVERAATPA